MSDTERDLMLFEFTNSGSITAVCHQFAGTTRATTTALRLEGLGLIREGDLIKAEGPDVLAEKVGSFVMPPRGEARVLASGKSPLRVDGKAVATTGSRVQTDCQVQPVCSGKEIFQNVGELIRIDGESVIPGR